MILSKKRIWEFTFFPVATKIREWLTLISKSIILSPPLGATTDTTGPLDVLLSHFSITPFFFPMINNPASAGDQASFEIDSADPLGATLYVCGGEAGLQVSYTRIKPSWQPVAIFSVFFYFIKEVGGKNYYGTDIIIVVVVIIRTINYRGKIYRLDNVLVL